MEGWEELAGNLWESRASGWIGWGEQVASLGLFNEEMFFCVVSRYSVCC